MNRYKQLLRENLRKAFFFPIQVGLFTRFQQQALLSRGAVTILNLHRISDLRRADVTMTPAVFDDMLTWITRSFTVTSFGKLNEDIVSEKPLIILSFDDGYKDFIDVAVPILSKHRLIVNQNIIPSVVQSGLPPMNVQLQDFILTAPSALLREVQLPGLPFGADPENRFGSCLVSSKAFKTQSIQKQVKQFKYLEQQFKRLEKLETTPVMNLDEVRQISHIHELGAHSFEHASMAEESNEYLINDVKKCREFFAASVDVNPIVYAFPNGSNRVEQPEIVREGGFSHVLVGGNRCSAKKSWLHPRFNMYARSRYEARAKSLGLQLLGRS